jgi:hypothetical protein
MRKNKDTRHKDTRPWVIVNTAGKPVKLVRTNRLGRGRTVVSEFDSYREAAFIARQLGLYPRRI